MENSNRFYKCLSQFLTMRRWNALDLIAKIGIDVYPLHSVVTGRQKPTLEQFEKILKALNVSAEDFRNPEKFKTIDWKVWDTEHTSGRQKPTLEQFEKTLSVLNVSAEHTPELQLNSPDPSICKRDLTKPQVAYVLGGFHSVMLEVAECGTPDGKYAPYSWKNCKVSDLLDAAGRHFLSHIGGELIDPEDGRQHIVKAIWNLCAARQIESEKG